MNTTAQQLLTGIKVVDLLLEKIWTWDQKPMDFFAKDGAAKTCKHHQNVDRC
jgi:hypothetical protein